ncbi:sensor histidine kinase [Halovulum marinum]|nr:HAMP domain-containing sensor histidine kinase [Halovulum marinum]
MAALFALISLTSLAVTYAIVRENTVQALRATLEQEVAGFRALPDTAAVVTFVRSQSETASPEDRILSYVLPGGLHVGNTALTSNEDGHSAVSFDDDARDIDGDYFVLSTPVHGGQLTIALSAEPLQDLREAFLAVFLFSLIPTTLIVVGGGVLLARRSVHRLNRIDTVLDRLTTGDYAARVAPMPGRADDLTRIGARIDKMAAVQEQQISALKQVSADIAHDLKTPIQRVSVLLDQLRDKVRPDGGAASLVDRATAETEGIVRTFQALLQIAQVEGGSPKQRFKPVDIAALARTFCELYEPSAEETGHALTRDIPHRPILVNGEKSLLGQVFANLIENALRHTPTGTTVSVGVAPQAGTVRVSVSDTGPGIPEAERKNVLRRLYRLEHSRTTPGNGLGLSLVAAIVEMHDGDLVLEDNAPGLRAVITFQTAGTGNARA